MTRVYCLAEDRPTEEVGLRLAVASLLRACPTAEVVVHRPSPSAAFARWLVRWPTVRLVADRPAGASSWNCKPHVLIPLLEGGYDEAVWLDSDLIVTRDPGPLFDGRADDELTATEEPPTSPHQGTASRTPGWGWPLARRLGVTLNTCVVRVTRRHLPLLRRWRECLAHSEYVVAQTRPVGERPPHLMSDQDVLTALLGADTFAGVPVRYLTGGREVIHCGGALGYSLGMRVSGFTHPIPTFLHAIAGKPWAVLHPNYRDTHTAWFGYYRGLLQETSAYVLAARRFRREVGVPCPWVDPITVLGLVLRMVGFGHYSLTGLPLTVAATLAVTARRAMRGVGR